MQYLVKHKADKKHSKSFLNYNYYKFTVKRNLGIL